MKKYLDDAERLVDGRLLVERVVGINLRGHLSGDDLEDLATKLNEELVESGIDLLINILALYP